MELIWKAAVADLGGDVVGYVERVDGETYGRSIELPLASPLLHVVLGADYLIERDGAAEVLPPVSLWGCSMRPRAACPTGRLHALVVVLTHRGAAALAGAGPLADRIVGLGDGWSGVRDALMDAPTFEARVGLIEAALRRRLSARPRALGSKVLAIADAVAAHRLAGPVAALAASHAVTERTLRNRFAAEIGCSPKRLLRLARLGRTVRALHPRPWGGRPAHDVRLEYFDDAHLHREFRALTGVSPAEFARSKRRSGDALVHSLLL